MYLKNSAKVTVTDSLTTNASQALVGIDNSAADIQKDFVTLSQSEISAENDARIYINSTKKGLVQFSGNTRISDNVLVLRIKTHTGILPIGLSSLNSLQHPVQV